MSLEDFQILISRLDSKKVRKGKPRENWVIETKAESVTKRTEYFTSLKSTEKLSIIETKNLYNSIDMR